MNKRRLRGRERERDIKNKSKREREVGTEGDIWNTHTVHKIPEKWTSLFFLFLKMLQSISLRIVVYAV
jgi:hypothetical protein